MDESLKQEKLKTLKHEHIFLMRFVSRYELKEILEKGYVARGKEFIVNKHKFGKRKQMYIIEETDWSSTQLLFVQFYTFIQGMVKHRTTKTDKVLNLLLKSFKKYGSPVSNMSFTIHLDVLQESFVENLIKIHLKFKEIPQDQLKLWRYIFWLMFKGRTINYKKYDLTEEKVNQMTEDYNNLLKFLKEFINENYSELNKQDFLIIWETIINKEMKNKEISKLYDLIAKIYSLLDSRPFNVSKKQYEFVLYLRYPEYSELNDFATSIITSYNWVVSQKNILTNKILAISFLLPSKHLAMNIIDDLPSQKENFIFLNSKGEIIY